MNSEVLSMIHPELELHETIAFIMLLVYDESNVVKVNSLYRDTTLQTFLGHILLNN